MIFKQLTNPFESLTLNNALLLKKLLLLFVQVLRTKLTLEQR